jgi:hypothetical protein
LRERADRLAREKGRLIEEELERSYPDDQREARLHRRQERMRQHYRGSMVLDESRHDKEVRRLFREHQKRWREQGADDVKMHRSELDIRRQVGRELARLRAERRVELDDPEYRLSEDERRAIAEKHDVPFVNGHMAWPDLEAEVKVGGEKYIVSFDAETSSYTSRMVRQKRAAGFVTSRVGGHARVKTRRPRLEPDIVMQIVRGR